MDFAGSHRRAGDRVRTITIVAIDGNHFDIHEGERYVTRLTWEEMLGSIAEITHPRIGASRFDMKSADEHVERFIKYNNIIKYLKK